jgi:heat shock protein HslJ
MFRHIAAPALLAGVLALSACAQPDRSDDDSSAETLVGTEWQLSEISGAPVASDAWLAFESGGMVSGHAGCNQFGGDYDRDGTGLMFSNISATMMACTDPGRMSTEAGFLAALQATELAVASDGVLELRNRQGDLLATLVRRG